MKDVKPMYKWLSYVVLEWVVISVAILLCYLSWWFLPLAWFVIGSRQHALLVLGHEAVHQPELNKTIANLLTFWPIGVDIDGYRKFHIPHHQFLGTEKDPEVILRSSLQDTWMYTKITSLKKRLLFLGDLFGMNTKEFRGVAKFSQGNWTSKARLLFLFSTIMVIPLWVLVFWIFCMYTTNIAFMRQRMLREHIDTDGTHRYVAKWWERLTYLPHNIWKHWDHHQPGRWNIPVWNLKE